MIVFFLLVIVYPTILALQYHHRWKQRQLAKKRQEAFNRKAKLLWPEGKPPSEPERHARTAQVTESSRAGLRGRLRHGKASRDREATRGQA